MMDPIIKWPPKFSEVKKIIEMENISFGEFNMNVDSSTITSLIDTFPEGFLVAEDLGKIIGYGGVEKHEDDKTLLSYNHNVFKTHNPKGEFLYVDFLNVAPEYRNRGVGSKIVSRFNSVAFRHKCKAIYLPLAKNHPYLNEGIKNFWERNRYEVVGEDEEWEAIRGKPMSCYVMMKTLYFGPPPCKW